MKNKIILILATLGSGLLFGNNELNTISNKNFLYASVGTSSIEVSNTIKNNKIINKNFLDNTGEMIDFGAGIDHNQNIFSTVGVSFTSLDLVDIKDFYATVNYKFKYKSLTPYVGLLAGYSHLSWLTKPYTLDESIKSNSDKLTLGLQAGIKQKISEDISFVGQYQFLKYGHNLVIKNENVGKLSHNYAHKFLVGVQYGI